MPGGNPAAWPHVKDIFQSIAAKVDDGTPCCDWVGEDGAGHFVKMVHNGIEYGDMQLICEAYDLLHRGLGLTADELAEVFTEWNKGELDSFLIEISSHIFAKKDEDGQPLVDKILDTAGQKGTGKWTVIQRARHGPAGHPDWRVGLRALPLSAERRTRRRFKDTRGPGCRRRHRPS
jgi:6-phosphogluconate dehydrogenase